MLRGLIFRFIEHWSPMGNAGGLTRFGAARATLIVNLMGSLLLGLIVGTLPNPTLGASDPALAFWVTGLCGAVTTFSTLCADAIGLARSGDRIKVAVVLLANTVLGIAALLLGLRISS
jgi:CrcB protein